MFIYFEIIFSSYWQTLV